MFILLWNASSTVCYFEMLLRPGAEHLKYYAYPSRECHAVHDCMSSSH